MARLVIEAGRRLVALTILYDASTILVSHMLPNGLGMIVLVVTILLAASMALIGSLTVYILAVSLVTLFSAMMHSIPLASITCLPVLLLLDTVSSIYKGGELSWSGLSSMDIARSLASLLLLYIPMLLVSMLLAYISWMLVESMENAFLSAAVTNPLVSRIVLSKVFITALTIILVIYFYRVLKAGVEVVALFLFATSRQAVKELARDSDVDLVFSPPFSWFLELPIVFLIYPFFYTVIYDVYLPLILGDIPGSMPQGITLFLQFATGLLAFTISTALVRDFIDPGALRGVEIDGGRGLIIKPLIFTLFIYLTSVMLALRRGYPIIDSLLSPSFSELAGLISSNYIDSSSFFVSLLSDVLRILGVVT